LFQTSKKLVVFFGFRWPNKKKGASALGSADPLSTQDADGRDDPRLLRGSSAVFLGHISSSQHAQSIWVNYNDLTATEPWNHG
jgi:hypothetical protein